MKILLSGYKAGFQKNPGLFEIETFPGHAFIQCSLHLGKPTETLYVALSFLEKELYLSSCSTRIVPTHSRSFFVRTKNENSPL